MERSLNKKIIAAAVLALCLTLSAAPSAARAQALLPSERAALRLAAPVENNSGFRVWGSKYYPGDVLSEKMTEYFYSRLREIPRVEASIARGGLQSAWGAAGTSAGSLVVRVNLEGFNYKKKDTLGSKVEWDVALHMYVYNAATRALVFDSLIEERGGRRYPLYNDTLEKGPIYWDQFAKSPYWPAICKALDKAFGEIVGGYNGYRAVGQIAAKAERVDGSLSVAKKDQDKLWHVTMGRADAVRTGDVLIVTRASSVRTVTPERPEMHFPQVVGRVKVVFLKGSDAVVRVVKESSDAPIQLGDAVSVSLAARGTSYF